MRRRSLLTAVSALLFSLAVAASFYRASRHGLELRDFRDGIYYAVVALLDGNNPYNTPVYQSIYPVEQGYSPYAPAFLALHLPFGLLPFQAAQVVYFATMVGLTLLLVRLGLRRAGRAHNVELWLALSTAVLLSRPGSWTMGLGQFSLQFGIGTVLALAFAGDRPLLAAIGAAITFIKPTYGVPVALLLMATGRWQVLVGGGLLSGLLSLPPLLRLLSAAGGVGPFIAGLRASYANFADDPTASAATGPERVDVIGLLGHALGQQPPALLELSATLSVLAIGVLAYRRIVGVGGDTAQALALSVGMLTVTICVYHQTYDLPMFIVPLVLLCASGGSPVVGGLHAVLVGLVALPMVNYVSPQAVQNWLGTTGTVRGILTSLNGILLLAAFAVAVRAVWLASTAADRRTTTPQWSAR